MNFRNAIARQPEIIRSVQKDANYTNELSEDISELLRITGPRNWIKYSHLCKLIAEFSYHGFASLNSLQTLGEEYTGIIQINSNYTHIPSKLLQLTAIILEFGGDIVYLKVLQKLEKLIKENESIVPDAKRKLLNMILIMRASPEYIKALHKTIFYLRASKYQISKRFTGINYVLIRHWLQPNHSLYGYKILGMVTSLRLILTFVTISRAAWKKYKQQLYEESTNTKQKTFISDIRAQTRINPANKCMLCLEPRKNTSLTPCGHLFCWNCILEWLNEREECPLCRETVKKSHVIPLRNYS